MAVVASSAKTAKQAEVMGGAGAAPDSLARVVERDEDPEHDADGEEQNAGDFAGVAGKPCCRAS